MKIGIIGAGGDVGRKLTEMYMNDRLPSCSSLTLFYHSEKSRSMLYGLLYDSMMQGREQTVSVTNRSEDLKELELIVLCAGRSIPSDIHKVYPMTEENRNNGRKSFLENRTIVLEWAEQIHRFCPKALVVLVTNPVAGLLAEIVSAYPELQVAGCGITNDTLRVRNETARQFSDVKTDHLFMIGEHDLLNQTVAFPFPQESGKIPERTWFESTFETESEKRAYLTQQKETQNRRLSEGGIISGLYEDLPVIYRSFLKHRFSHFLCKTHRSTALAIREIIEAFAQEDRWVSVETAVREDPEYPSCILGLPVKFVDRKIVPMIGEWMPEEEAVLRSMAEKYRI